MAFRGQPGQRHLDVLRSEALDPLGAEPALIDSMTASIESARDSAASIAVLVREQSAAAGEIGENPAEAAHEVQAFIH